MFSGRTSYKAECRVYRRPDVGAREVRVFWNIIMIQRLHPLKDNGFVVPRYESEVTKQIDVLARDEQCICFVECKAAEKPHTRRYLDKDLDQFAAVRHELELSVFSHYRNLGNKTKFKAVWLLALKNIDIGENDVERAEKAKIKILDESMVDYYSDLSKHFGRSSKYQFLADMFPGIDIPNLIDPLPAIKGGMGKTVFYSFVIEPEKLLKIAFLAHRAKTNEESRKRYQRMASKARLNQIAKYIHEKEGVFPTSIVLSIDNDNKPLRFEPATDTAGKNAVAGKLYLPNKYKTAWVVDGQHRLFAYSDLEEAKTATLPVIAFENLKAEIQQRLFIDINGEQVKVSKNLLNDLYANLHWNSNSPSERLLALTSTLIKELNEWTKSPFRDRIIKIGGLRTKTRNLTLTALATEISKSRLLGYVTSNKAKEITPGHLFQDDMDSSLIRARDIIAGYYDIYLVNENLKRQWEIGSGDGGYICTNVGILATLRVLRAILDHLQQRDGIEVRQRNKERLLDDIKKYLTPLVVYLASASPKTIKEFKDQQAESGVRASTFAMYKIINSDFPQFQPPGFDDYIKETDTSNNAAAYQYLLQIEPMIQVHVINALKTKFGSEYSQWWHQGVKENTRKNAMSLASQQGQYSGFEKFLCLIDLKDIISDNWDVFSETYTVDAKPSDSKSKRLSWYTTLNEIRNIVDHPPRGGVTNEQLDFVVRIYKELHPRIGGDQPLFEL